MVTFAQKKTRNRLELKKLFGLYKPQLQPQKLQAMILRKLQIQTTLLLGIVMLLLTMVLKFII